MPFTYHVDQFDASQERLCTPERFESQHLPYATFDISVILLNQVIQILVLPDSNGFFFWFVGVSVVSAAALAPLLSMVTTSGSP